MEKKRSKGVSVLAWLLIISSSYQFIMGLALLFSGTNYFLSILLRSVIYPVAIVISVYLLKLKNWARVGTIALCALGAIAAIAEAPLASASLRATGQNYQSTMFPMILSVYILALVFYCVPIYFFTRHKVKEQFRQP